ncbi:MAG: glycosidase, partial [Gammaproteobacteria bacterium]|nr:glycosidase [Gammaproteobacteria bacterium]
MSHIIRRVLELDPQTVRQQLADVLESFQGRHRRLLATFETRADTMEIAHSMHAPLTNVQRQLIG